MKVLRSVVFRKYSFAFLDAFHTAFFQVSSTTQLILKVPSEFYPLLYYWELTVLQIKWKKNSDKERLEKSFKY